MLQELYDVVTVTEAAALIAYVTSLLGLAFAPSNKVEAKKYVEKAVKISTLTHFERLHLECQINRSNVLRYFDNR